MLRSLSLRGTYAGASGGKWCVAEAKKELLVRGGTLGDLDLGVFEGSLVSSVRTRVSRRFAVRVAAVLDMLIPLYISRVDAKPL